MKPSFLDTRIGARSAWMWVVWPSFLCACILEMLVFAAVDPGTLALTHAPYNWSTQAVYSASFFVLWTGTLLSSVLTVWLSSTKQ
jgi:hypothetical protein